MRHARGSSRIVAAIVGVAAGLVAALPAQAYHIPGATYEGTHSQGGRVSFTVTSDGEGLSSFSAYGPIRGSTCTFGSSGEPITTTYVQPLPIVDHTFEDTTQPFFSNGSFREVQGADGTFRARTTSPSCDTGELTWNASTTASPARSEECRRARAARRRAQRAVRRARSRRARRRAQQRLRRARRTERADCG
jgi:hypothetical protein